MQRNQIIWCSFKRQISVEIGQNKRDSYQTKFKLELV